MSAPPHWPDVARAAGWPPDAVARFDASVAEWRAAWVFADADVLALRTRLGALLCELRADDLATIARANRATAHLPGYVPPAARADLPSCEELHERARAPSPARVAPSPQPPVVTPTLAVTNERDAPARSPLPVATDATTATDALDAWTDGSGTVADAPAGIGVVLARGGEVLAEASAPIGRGSNNVAEVRAIGRALALALDVARDRTAPLVVHSDSAFAIGAVRHGSTYNLRSNPALTTLALAVRAEVARWPGLTFDHVRGHAGVGLNPRADELAGRARRAAIAATTTPNGATP